MNMDTKSRVLVATVGAWSSRIGSDSMSSLMKDYGPDRVAALYIRADKSDSTSASRYFHIFEGRVMMSIFRGNIQTGEEFKPQDVVITESSDEQAIEKARYNFFSKHRWGIFLFARELIWKLGKWKSPELDAFLDDFRPEVLICPIESYIHFNKLNEYIIRRCKPKVIGLLWDDNFTYKQEPYNLWHQVHRIWLRRSVRNMVKKCHTVFCLSPKMKEECDKEFCIESQLLTKPVVIRKDFQPYKIGKPIKILYTGKLIIGRDRTIAKVVEAIQELNKYGQRVVLEIYTQTNLSSKIYQKINVPGCCSIFDPIPQNEVLVKQSEADILLFVESLSGKCKTARLSFSTKLTDYFSAGKCIWAIGHEDLGPIDYLQREDAGLVSTDKKSIRETLNQIINHKELITEYAEKAYRCGSTKHNKDMILNRLYSAIVSDGALEKNIQGGVNHCKSAICLCNAEGYFIQWPLDNCYQCVA